MGMPLKLLNNYTILNEFCNRKCKLTILKFLTPEFTEKVNSGVSFNLSEA